MARHAYRRLEVVVTQVQAQVQVLVTARVVVVVNRPARPVDSKSARIVCSEAEPPEQQRKEEMGAAGLPLA